jgi:hypothetical protein
MASAVPLANYTSGFSLRKNSGFVSGHRFSDAVNASKSDVPLGARHRKSSFSANCLAAGGHPPAAHNSSTNTQSELPELGTFSIE